MNIILFGPPGVGKGTQAALLKEKFRMLHVSTGEALRNEVRNKTPLGLKAKEAMDKGALVSDDIVAGIVVNAMENLGDRSGVMLDGFPRNIPQAERLDKVMADRGIKLDHVVSLEADREIILKRLSGRRFCDHCGKDYNVHFNPPKVAGECDVCDGGRLVQRSDDNEKVHLDRLNVYEAQTQPLKQYYLRKGFLRTVNGMGSPQEVFSEVCKILG